MSSRLYIVAECPASPGFGGVVALLSLTSDRLVFFAPCCGLAWHSAPIDGRLDSINTLESLEPRGVRLPSVANLATNAPSLTVLREEPLHSWIADIPGLAMDR